MESLDDALMARAKTMGLGQKKAAPQPVSATQRTANALRPERFSDIVGQTPAKRLMEKAIHATKARDTHPLDHILLVGASGTGKTTFAHVIANEMDVDCYAVEAPIAHETLMELRETMRHWDILFIDEIHMQAIQERRGKTSNTQPEVLFGVMEDRRIVSGGETYDFPWITLMGATTDEGMLPEAFINRFPLRPHLQQYDEDELTQIALMNAPKLATAVTDEAARMFAKASRRVPRQINNYMKNAALLSGGGTIDRAVAEEVLHELNRVTDDGLTPDMQNVLTFLYTRAKRTNGKGDTIYQASVNTIATAIGKSRDTKAIQLRVEPFLIEEGYLQVGHGGRLLTDTGVARAISLLAGGTNP